LGEVTATELHEHEKRRKKTESGMNIYVGPEKKKSEKDWGCQNFGFVRIKTFLIGNCPLRPSNEKDVGRLLKKKIPENKRIVGWGPVKKGRENQGTQ